MRSARRAGIAVLFMAIVVIVGTIGGWFNIADAMNSVQVNTIENDFGGTTLMKATTNNKEVSWTQYYDSVLTPTMNEKKAYSYTEATDAEDYIVQYTMTYITPESVESVIGFYTDYYGETKMDTDSSGDVYLSASKNEFQIWINIEKETDGTDIMLTATHESVVK